MEYSPNRLEKLDGAPEGKLVELSSSAALGLEVLFRKTYTEAGLHRRVSLAELVMVLPDVFDGASVRPTLSGMYADREWGDPFER